MKLLKYLTSLFNWGSLGKKREIDRQIKNTEMEKVNISYDTIKSLRKRLIPFQVDVNTKSLKEHRDHFDTLAKDFIDLDVPDRYRRRIVADLSEANAFFNLLTEEDFKEFENNRMKRNEVHAILSSVARKLGETLVALQKEIGVL